MKMCVVIDLDIVCLICIQPSKDMYSIFTEDGDDSELQVAQKITILSELKIDQSNKTLPKKICGKCLQDLKAAWRFRKNCQAAVTLFRTIVKLDDLQPESASPEKSTDQQIKLPHGLQIKRVIIDDKSDESKKATESAQLQKTSTIEEFIINNEEEGSVLYEGLGAHNYAENHNNDTEEFQAMKDADKNDEQYEVQDDDENTLVEYYLTEDGTSDETTKNFTKNANKDELEKIQTKVNQQDREKLRKPATNEEKTCKPVKRGRPRTQNMVPKEVAKNKNVVQTTTKGTVVIENPNSSEDATLPEVRQVKTRKRKQLSPETKTAKICEICGNSYRFQHALNAHMRRHYNHKPFPCEFCDKAFVSNVELRRHMRVHTGQKPYACQYCERRFSDFGSRIKHERTHTGERPYQCNTCGKSFAYPHVLSVHVRTHTGEKRFRCDYCSKGFTKKAYLLSHVNQHHSSSHNFQVIIEDTIDKGQTHSQSEDAFEECVYTTEYVNEEEIDDAEEYDEVTNQEPGKIIMPQSLMEPKIEIADETEIQENTEQLEEFRIS